jgi:hypothetical protein
MSLCVKPFAKGIEEYGCGNCIPCRVTRRRAWTHRLILESFLHEKCSFVTLTYDDDHLPHSYGEMVQGKEINRVKSKEETLDPVDLTKFIKNLRKEIHPRKIKYYAVGEYGDQTERPHYHLAIFGMASDEPSQFVQLRKRSNDPDVEIIRRKWGKGAVDVAELNRLTAQYLCGYVTKKMTDKNNEDTKKWLKGRHPEFMHCSNGLGAGAASSIAEICRKHYQKIVENGDVPNYLKHGNKKMPLDSYMKEQVRKKLFCQSTNRVTYHKKYSYGEFTYISTRKVHTSRMLKSIEKRVSNAYVQNEDTKTKITLSKLQKREEEIQQEIDKGNIDPLGWMRKIKKKKQRDLISRNKNLKKGI